MNKQGNIILLDDNSESSDYLCKSLKQLGHKNEVLCFNDAAVAGNYLRENLPDIFMLLQSSTSPGVHVPDTRNMIYLHEKFDTDKIPYMFLVLTKDRLPQSGPDTFVHCYYKPLELTDVSATLAGVIDFWKSHVFPPRVVHNQDQ